MHSLLVISGWVLSTDRDNGRASFIAALMSTHLDEYIWSPDAKKFQPGGYLEFLPKVPPELDSMPWSQQTTFIAGERFVLMVSSRNSLQGCL